VKNEDHVHELLAGIKRDEKEWRTAANAVEASPAKTVAEENLRRLDGLRHSLQSHLESLGLRRQQVMKLAIVDGIFTDHLSDGVCEKLLGEGWLERADPLPVRPHVNRAHAYLPTEKAVQDWNTQVVE